MKRNHRYVRFGTAAVALLAACLGWGQLGNDKVMASVSKQMADNAALFRENKGQWDKQAQFLSQTQGLDYWVTKTGVVQ